MIVGGIMMIAVIITLIIFFCRGRICVRRFSSESQDSFTSKPIATPLKESLIEEPETIVINSGFWDFSHDAVSTIEQGQDSL
jgi:hypothetical protein